MHTSCTQRSIRRTTEVSGSAVDVECGHVEVDFSVVVIVGDCKEREGGNGEREECGEESEHEPFDSAGVVVEQGPDAVDFARVEVGCVALMRMVEVAVKGAGLDTNGAGCRVGAVVGSEGLWSRGRGVAEAVLIV